ncbi:hypothetical protein ACPPVW_06610 [Leifsonia sp. McL0607]|uniref:hypothetical protein n=1 Tax=Leifsonia sp. McL0607 TaxID=3415672 RepID=UPI003CF094C0
MAIILALLAILATGPAVLFWRLTADDSYQDHGRDPYLATAHYRFDSDLDLPAPRWYVDQTAWTPTANTDSAGEATFTSTINSCTLLTWKNRTDSHRPDVLATTDRAATISAFRAITGLQVQDLEATLVDDVVGFGPDGPYQADVLTWTDPDPEPGQHRRILARASISTHQVIGFTTICETDTDLDTALGELNHSIRISG